MQVEPKSPADAKAPADSISVPAEVVCGADRALRRQVARTKLREVIAHARRRREVSASTTLLEIETVE